MRGARERTAFQYKNKKLQQAFLQELSVKTSNNSSLMTSNGTPQSLLGGQQIMISYCNINNIPPSKEQQNNDIPDYNALIEMQNQLKREQMKIEDKIKQVQISTTPSIEGKVPKNINADPNPLAITAVAAPPSTWNKESMSGASGSTQAALASSIASGSSGGGVNPVVNTSESRTLATTTLSLTGKYIPLVQTEYNKKKNLLLQNFPARVSTPSKQSMQLLEGGGNSSNFRESFTDFQLQVRSNMYTRHHAVTEIKDSGLLNINATQVVSLMPKTAAIQPAAPAMKEESGKPLFQQEVHQIFQVKRDLATTQILGGGTVQKSPYMPLAHTLKGSLSQNMIIGTKLNPASAAAAGGMMNFTQPNSQAHTANQSHDFHDGGANSPTIKGFEESNQSSPLKKLQIRANQIQGPIIGAQSSTPQGKSVNQQNLLPPLKKQLIQGGGGGSGGQQQPTQNNSNLSQTPSQQHLQKQSSQVIKVIQNDSNHQKSLRKQQREDLQYVQHGGDVARGQASSNNILKTTTRLSLTRGAGGPNRSGNQRAKEKEDQQIQQLQQETLNLLNKPVPSPNKGHHQSTTEINRQIINLTQMATQESKNVQSPKLAENRQNSILKKMISENIQTIKSPNLRNNNQSPFTALKKEPLLTNNIVKTQYTQIKRNNPAAQTSPGLPPPTRQTQESFRPRSKQGLQMPQALPSNQQQQPLVNLSPNKKQSIFQTNSRFSSRQRLSMLNTQQDIPSQKIVPLEDATPQPTITSQQDSSPQKSQPTTATTQINFNRYFGLEDQEGNSSEESSISDDPEEFSERLKYLVRNEDAMEFSQYCVQQLQRKREKLIKNSFAANVNGKRIGPNNITQYDHIGYCPDKTEPKWKKEVQVGIGPTIQAPALMQRENQGVSNSSETTRASSAPTSDNTRDYSSIYRIIVKDELKIFDEADIDFIVEQAQLKVYPQVLAKQWAIAEARKGTPMYGKEINIPNEIASQTKIMTAYVVMKMIEELEIEQPKNYYIRVTKKAEKIKGTKAGLIRGQLISIYDCLHALMLPSGNDAALTLATAFGKFLHFSTLTEKRKNVPRDADEEVKKTLIKHLSQPLKKYHEAAQKIDNKMYIQSFVAEMNKHAKLLKVEETTQFTNPHGLADKNNHSTPADICRIASFAMKNPLFKEIVCRKFYECTVISREHNICLLQWFNSNKLLNDFFLGIKTGTTPSAGPCLCGYFQYGDFCAIACVMNTKTTESRFKDMAILFLWALDKYMCGLTCSEPGNNSSNAVAPNWTQSNTVIAMKRRLKWTSFNATNGSGTAQFPSGSNNVLYSGNIQDQHIEEEDHSLNNSGSLDPGDVKNQFDQPLRKGSSDNDMESRGTGQGGIHKQEESNSQV